MRNLRACRGKIGFQNMQTIQKNRVRSRPQWVVISYVSHERLDRKLCCEPVRT